MSTTTYSGPRSRCGGAPWASSTLAPPRMTRSSGQRPSTRWTYRPSSRSFSISATATRGDCFTTRRPPPPLCAPAALGSELVGVVRSHAGDRGRLRVDLARDLGDLVERHRVQRVDRSVGVDVLAEDD